MARLNIIFDKNTDIDKRVREIEALGAEILVVSYRIGTATVQYTGDPAALHIDDVYSIEADSTLSASQ